MALTKDDFPDEERSATKTAAQQEMERLLYVATTRARHTLVLALDEEIFARSNGELQNGAQLKCLLGEKQINRPHFDTLCVEATRCPETSKAGEQRAAGSEVETPPPPARIDRKGLKLAKERAANFVRKFSPSGYDEGMFRAPADEISESAPLITAGRPPADTPATLYGLCMISCSEFHGADDKIHGSKSVEHQARSPTKRSAGEWELFLQCLKDDPDFSKHLTHTKSITHAEMPFFWRIDDSRCLEGIADLALIEPDKKTCLIVDWKTNRITADKIDSLRERYRPQIASYWQAITQMSGMTVRAEIYSTATGKFLPYAQEELAHEWDRLKNLAQPELAAVVAAE